MKAIDIIRQASQTARRSIEIPEWRDPDGHPLVLWFGRLTAADLQAIEERQPRDHHERNVLLLIHKAQDEGGQPIFEFGDRLALLREADFVVLQRIIAFMFERTYPTVEAAAEALRANPPFDSASS